MQAKLVVVEGRAGRREVVLTLPASIGRRAHQTLQILHPTVSREHCELVEQDGQILVRDKKSANGTWIGGMRITESLLRPGDRLTVGPLVFEADYLPGNGAAIASAPSAKKAGAPGAKKGASTAAVQPAPAPVAEDDFEAALAADLMAELGGISSDEVEASAAAPTLDGDPLPAGEFDHLADNLVSDDLGIPSDELDVELLGSLEAELGEPDLALPSLDADELADFDFKELEVESGELNFEPVAEVASLELDDQVAADLDLDLTSAEPDFSDLAAESPAALTADSLSSDAEPSLDDLLASDGPSAPWDAIGDELDADLALDEEANDVDLALGDLGLEAVELDSLDVNALDLNAAEPGSIEVDSSSAGALDLDDLSLESPEIDGLELEFPDSLDAISNDLASDAELELPLRDDLPGDLQSAAASVAPPASLDDFFAGLNGGESGAADDMPAIELDDLNLDAEISEIEFESEGAAPEIVAIDFGAELGGADSVASPQLGDELNLDVDLEFDDLKLDDGQVDEIDIGASEIGAGEIESSEFGDVASGEEASLRIADLDLDSDPGLEHDSEELSLDEMAAASSGTLADADELIFDLDSDEPEIAVDGPVEELHLFREDEASGSVLEESIVPEDSPDTALDSALELPVETGSEAIGLSDSADLPLDVLSDTEPREPSSSDEAAQQGTIFAPESDILADGDSQDLWPVDEGIAATDVFSLDELSLESDMLPPVDELIAPELDIAGETPLDTSAPDSDMAVADGDLESKSEVAAEEPAAAWNEPLPVIPAAIPTAPDDVDPFDFLSMEGTSAGAAEIVEPFVDDEDTPYDPDSPRQRLQGLSPDAPPSTSENAQLADGATTQANDTEAHDAQATLPTNDSNDIFFVDEQIAYEAPAVDMALPLDDAAAQADHDAPVDSGLSADEVAPPEAEFVLDDDSLSFDEVEPAQAASEPVDELPSFDDAPPTAELGAEDDLDSLFAEFDAGAPAVDEPLAFDEPEAASDELLTDNLLADDSLADDLLADLGASQATDETLDVNAESLLTFNETSVEELARLDAGDEALPLLSPPDEFAPVDEPAPLDDELALGELDLGEAAPGELGIGDSDLGDLELGASDLGELDLGEPNLETALDSFPEIAAESGFPAPARESAAFDFLEAPSAGSTAPPQGERIWWPFGDKSTAKANSPTGSPTVMPSESTARAVETNEIAELPSFAEASAPAGPEAPLELGAAPARDELSFEDASLSDVGIEDVARDELNFEDATPAETGQTDLAIDDLAIDSLALDSLTSDEPLAFDEPLALGDDANAAPDVNLNLPSPTESDATIAFLEDDESASLHGGPPGYESTAELPLAIEDDLGLSEESLDLSTPSPGPSVSADLTAAPASANPSTPARKWWQIWGKSGKPTAKSPKPAKSEKAAKKSKAVAEKMGTSGAQVSGIPSAATPSPTADDLLLLGGAGAAADELLLPDGPELDFAPLSLDDGPELADSAPVSAADEENFRTFYAEVVGDASPAVDDVDDLVFDAPEQESASAPSFGEIQPEARVSDLDAEPDFSAFDADDPFGEELSTGASTPDAQVDEFAVDEFAAEPQSASSDESEPKLPGEAETVDDNLLDDFFKNF